MYKLFEYHVENYPERPFMGTRPYDAKTSSFGSYQWKTTQEISQTVQDVGSGLQYLYQNYRVQAGENGQHSLGIYSTNRMEWMVSELAGFRHRMYSVGLADTAGVESAEFALNHSSTSVVVCSLDKLPRLLERLEEYTPHVKVIVTMDPLDCSIKRPETLGVSLETVQQLQEKAKQLNVGLYDFNQVIQLGQQHPAPAFPPSPSDIYTICYTSGTTGAQKGVVLTHSAFSYACRVTYLAVDHIDYVYASFIPLYHSFERFNLGVLMHNGVSIGFYSGDPALLMDDLQALRPTVLVAVPRLLAKIYESATQATIGATGLRGKLSRMAYNAKWQQLQNGGGTKHALWDRLVWSNVAARFGGRVHSIVIGAAAVCPEQLDFFRIALSCEVYQGYGQTESSCATSNQRARDYTGGHVGAPIPGVDVRLRSMPELGYVAEATMCPKGEIMVRGPHLFKEYLNEPLKTQMAFDGEWLATGDVGQINEDGSLALIDRVNNVVKTGLGVWVEPERLESVYENHPLVQSVFVDAKDSAKHLASVVVPKPEAFVPWAQKLVGNQALELHSLCKLPQVQVALALELRSFGLSHRLTEPELVGAVHLEAVPFEGKGCGLYTSTFKMRRSRMRQYYQTQLRQLFNKDEDKTAVSSPRTSTSAK